MVDTKIAYSVRLLSGDYYKVKEFVAENNISAASLLRGFVKLIKENDVDTVGGILTPYIRRDICPIGDKWHTLHFALYESELDALHEVETAIKVKGPGLFRAYLRSRNII